MVAALYAVMSYFGNVFGLTYGPIQLRFSEALCVLPFLFPEAIPGLTVGCFLANLLGSPIPLDWIVGTAATLLAALWTSKLHHRALAPLPPGIGEAAACFILGSLLLRVLPRVPALKGRIASSRI